MLSLLRVRWADLLHGFWFRPFLMAAGFGALAQAALAVDAALGTEGLTIAFGGDAPAARTILGTIATALITVAGLSLSITMVTLQLVSSQFTPRAVRDLLGEPMTQTAGAFVGIFVYCMLVLRAVRDRADDGTGGFVPGLSVSLGIVLAIVGLGLLILFIHSISQSIQVTNITARLAHGTLKALEHQYPGEYAETAPDADADELVRRWARDPSSRIFPDRPGYVQQIEVDSLMDEFAGHDRLVVHARPGDFVVEPEPLAEVWPPLDDSDTAHRVKNLIQIASARDLTQDAAYGFRQLADIALRALSPSLNDPTTALTCISYLGACLDRVTSRALPSQVRRDPGRPLEAVVRRVGYDVYVDPFVEIGRFAGPNARVVCALLDALAGPIRRAERLAAHERLRTLRAAADAIAERGLAEARTDADRGEIERTLGERFPWRVAG